MARHRNRRRTSRRANGGRDRTRPNPARPDMPWAAVVVLGEDEHPAFGYTNGLHEFYGHPELWMSGRAIDDSFEWCTSDVGVWLNHLARMVRDGEALEPGGAIIVEQPQYDLVLEFTVGEPVERLALEALLTQPHALVLPVHWTAMWLGEQPPWPRSESGMLQCPCIPTAQDGCADCIEEARRRRG